jgi:hypothetical protein
MFARKREGVGMQKKTFGAGKDEKMRRDGIINYGKAAFQLIFILARLICLYRED